MMRALRATLVMLALGFAAGGAGAQANELPADLPEATLTALRAEIAAARDGGLPTEPLVLKALEGRSKGATPGQILAAVTALRGRLLVAAELLGRDRGDDVLEAAAAALYAGINRTALSEIARTSRPETIGAALVVLGDLVRRGVPVPSAERAVFSLSAAGADARTLDEFRRSVDDDIRTGLAPGRAADIRLRGMLARVGRPGGTS